MVDPGFDAYPVAARKRNLRRATAAKEKQREMRELLKAKKLDPFSLLAGDGGEWEPIVKRLKISRVLLLIPGIGEVTRDELLAELGVTSDVKFEALTYERRQALGALVNAVLEPGADAVPST